MKKEDDFSKWEMEMDDWGSICYAMIWYDMHVCMHENIPKKKSKNTENEGGV